MRSIARWPIRSLCAVPMRAAQSKAPSCAHVLSCEEHALTAARGSAHYRDSRCITIAHSADRTRPARQDAEQSRPICSAANSQAPCQRRRRARAAPEIASAHPRRVRDAPCASKQCYATPVPDSPNIRRRRACAENWPAAPSSRTTKIVPWLMGSGAAQVREANTFRRGNRREAISEAVLVGVAGFEPATPSSRTRCATRLRYTPPQGRPYICPHRTPQA